MATYYQLQLQLFARHYKGTCRNDDLKRKVEKFFAPSSFFSSRSSLDCYTGRWKFVIECTKFFGPSIISMLQSLPKGISSTDDRKCILIAKDTMEKIHSELEAHVNK